MLVSLYKAKLHLRVTHDSEDATITLYLATAEHYVQQHIGRRVYATAVPADDLTGIITNPCIEGAILLICGTLYANRENETVGLSVSKMPLDAERLLQLSRYEMGL